MPLLIYALVTIPEDIAGFRDALVNTGVVSVGGVPELFVVGKVGAVALFVESVNVAPSTQELVRFADVVERIATLTTLLPVRYGSVAESPEALLRILSLNESQIVEVLGRVEGRAEFAVRIVSPESPSGIDPDEASETSPVYPQGIVGQSVYKNYLRGKYDAYRKESLKKREAELLMNSLKECIVCACPDAVFATVDSPGFMVNLSVLVHRSAQASLGQAFEYFRASHPDRPLLVTGPWPPYNFAALTIRQV